MAQEKWLEKQNIEFTETMPTLKRSKERKEGYSQFFTCWLPLKCHLADQGYDHVTKAAENGEINNLLNTHQRWNNSLQNSY